MGLRWRNTETLKRLAFLCERRPVTTYDAVVVGAGPNGLVAANHLVERRLVRASSWRPSPSPAVRSAVTARSGPLTSCTTRSVRSTRWVLPLQCLRSLDLEQFGLVWRHVLAVLGYLFPRHGWALQHRDRQVTAARMEAATPGTGGPGSTCATSGTGSGTTWSTDCSPPSRRSDPPWPGLARLRGVGGLASSEPCSHRRPSWARPASVARAPHPAGGQRGHSDIPLDARGSGVMALLLTMLGQTVGFPVPEGGAGELARRWPVGSPLSAARSAATRGDPGVTSRGRACGVVLADGERFVARRAVVADVAAPYLFGRLLDPRTSRPGRPRDAPLPDGPGHGQGRLGARRSGALAAPPAYAPGTVHVADSIEQMHRVARPGGGRSGARRPFLLAGQMTTTDPTRSPAGTESMWAYTHVPQQTVRDAGDGGIRGRGTMTTANGSPTGCRSASNSGARLRKWVLARRILGPRGARARNANLIGGAVGGGTAQLRQQLLPARPRPRPGGDRGAGFDLGSASAHPGGGVHGACGPNAARGALLHDRARRLVPRSGVTGPSTGMNAG